MKHVKATYFRSARLLVMLALLLACWAVIAQAQFSGYDGERVSAYRQANELKIGQVLIENDLRMKVTVRLFHPDSPDRPFGVWEVDPGESTYLSNSEGRIAIGSDWGVQMSTQFSSSQVRFVGKIGSFNNHHSVKLSYVLGGIAPSAFTYKLNPNDFGKWMRGRDYQLEFERQVREKKYPAKVEGIFHNGEPLFRALFEPFPQGDFAFDSRHGMTETFFENLNRKLTREGYKLVYSQKFTDGSGQAAYQATWVKR